MHKLELMLELRFSFFFLLVSVCFSQFGDTCMDFVHITTQIIFYLFQVLPDQEIHISWSCEKRKCEMVVEQCIYDRKFTCSFP